MPISGSKPIEPSQQPELTDRAATRVWRFLDGKPGHENQSAGLIRALAERLPLEVIDLPAMPPQRALAGLLRGAPAPALAAQHPPPGLIIGAGSATQLSMLASRRAYGGRSICLMKPKLPVWCFDLCLIPEHDRPPQRDNVIQTRGVLNMLTPTRSHDPQRGLILLGGESRHYRWNGDAIIGQILTVLHRNPDIAWQISDSRRTPAALAETLSGRLPGHARFVSHHATPRGWVAQQMTEAGTVWTTADSVSMVYEGLTSGARVGILQLQPRRDDRIVRGLRELARMGVTTDFAEWQHSGRLRENPADFDEAARCAGQIVARYFRSG